MTVRSVTHNIVLYPDTRILNMMELDITVTSVTIKPHNRVLYPDTRIQNMME